MRARTDVAAPRDRHDRSPRRPIAPMRGPTPIRPLPAVQFLQCETTLPLVIRRAPIHRRAPRRFHAKIRTTACPDLRNWSTLAPDRVLTPHNAEKEESV